MKLPYRPNQLQELADAGNRYRMWRGLACTNVAISFGLLIISVWLPNSNEVTPLWSDILLTLGWVGMAAIVGNNVRHDYKIKKEAIHYKVGWTVSAGELRRLVAQLEDTNAEDHHRVEVK